MERVLGLGMGIPLVGMEPDGGMQIVEREREGSSGKMQMGDGFEREKGFRLRKAGGRSGFDFLGEKAEGPGAGERDKGEKTWREIGLVLS